MLKDVNEFLIYSEYRIKISMLISIVVLQKYMPGKKVDDINHNYVECLLYTFHHLAHKVR